MTGEYCAHGDIGVLLEATFSSTTKPTDTQVTALIADMTSLIEEETGHAWRLLTATQELHDAGQFVQSWGYFGYEWMVKLNHRKIAQFASVSGDKIEYWNGAAWTDLVATGVEGRSSDWWCDYTLGILYIRGRFTSQRLESIRVTYRWGDTTVPGDIKLACMKLVAREVARSENRVELLTEGSNHMLWRDKTEQWDKEIERVFQRHREHRITVV